MIFDTDVLIWTLRGNANAARVIEEDTARAVSIVSCMELFQSCRDKRELSLVRRFLLNFETLPLSEDIGYRARMYMEQHAIRNRLTPVDAMIAATAVARQERLCTGNVKHFRPIAELKFKTFRP